MNNKVYSIFQSAKKNHDLKTMEKLYLEDKNDVYIKFEYAKLLNRFGRKKEAFLFFKELYFSIFNLKIFNFIFKSFSGFEFGPERTVGVKLLFVFAHFFIPYF